MQGGETQKSSPQTGLYIIAFRTHLTYVYIMLFGSEPDRYIWLRKKKKQMLIVIIKSPTKKNTERKGKFSVLKHLQ